MRVRTSGRMWMVFDSRLMGFQPGRRPVVKPTPVPKWSFALPVAAAGTATTWTAAATSDSRGTQPIAPLTTGLAIMPFSTPHLVAMALYSPVEITCSSACSSGSASPESLRTGQP